MTKRKALIQLVEAMPPTVPQNAMQQMMAKTDGSITGWLSNHKKGAPRKSKYVSQMQSTNARMTTIMTSPTVPITNVTFGATTTRVSRPKASDKAVAASTSKSKHTQGHSVATSRATCSPYTNEPPSKEPHKSVLAHMVEAKLKGLDQQKAVEEIIVPINYLNCSNDSK